jgi:hypothetical protein
MSEDGFLTSMRRKRVERHIEGGDSLDSTTILGGVALIGGMFGVIFFMFEWILSAVIWWLGLTGMVLSGMLVALGGVTLYWAVERSGYHVKAGHYKFMAFHMKYMQWTEETVKFRNGRRLTFLREGIRSGGVADWFKSHGGKTKPYIGAIVPGTERRFLSDGTEVGPDWKTPIDTYNQIKRKILNDFKRAQKKELCIDVNGFVCEYDENSDYIDQKVKDKPSERWVEEFFKRHVEVMENNGRMPNVSENPGKAGVWIGSDYIIPGDFNDVPNDKMSFGLRTLFEKDRPFFQNYSWALVSDTPWPWTGPICDLRAEDYIAMRDAGWLMSKQLAGALETAGETTVAYTDQMKETGPISQTIEFKAEEEKK